MRTKHALACPWLSLSFFLRLKHSLRNDHLYSEVKLAGLCGDRVVMTPVQLWQTLAAFLYMSMEC